MAHTLEKAAMKMTMDYYDKDIALSMTASPPLKSKLYYPIRNLHVKTLFLSPPDFIINTIINNRKL